MKINCLYGYNFDSNIYIIDGKIPTIIDCGTGLYNEIVIKKLNQKETGYKGAHQGTRRIDAIQDRSVPAKTFLLRNDMSPHDGQCSSHEECRADQQTKTEKKSEHDLSGTAQA